jgi:hypothetical protein
MTDFLKLGATKAHRIISNVQIRYFGSPLFIESPKWLILTLGRFMEWFAPKSRFLMCIVCRVE